ncbi:hypothetical protein [Solimicrobium silvestre]|uniref:Alpha/beta hydrolase family n=1 Tax=Solimicrobium silvestre TaxID=2099400 RepID=A0A2S9H4A7_9BURK|nr:hypothetical protein [Solimicrobium silvestre]PRC94820.1 hypothetical protein S2091_0015 [Solimicrobium silvestre]
MAHSKTTSILRKFFFGSVASTSEPLKIESVEINRPEGKRHYLKALPSRASSNKRPLVILLHGAGASAAQILGLKFPPSPLSMWLEIAEREQLVIVAPDGRKNNKLICWNDSCSEIAGNPKTDDTGFINAIIDKVIVEDTRMIWGGEAHALQVELIRIENGGHSEPSVMKRYPRWLTFLVGAQNADIEAAEEAWEFFKDKRSELLINQIAGNFHTID